MKRSELKSIIMECIHELKEDGNLSVEEAMVRKKRAEDLKPTHVYEKPKKKAKSDPTNWDNPSYGSPKKKPTKKVKRSNISSDVGVSCGNYGCSIW